MSGLLSLLGTGAIVGSPRVRLNTQATNRNLPGAKRRAARWTDPPADLRSPSTVAGTVASRASSSAIRSRSAFVPCFHLRLGEAARDVLRAVPVERRHLEERHALDPGTVAGEVHAADEVRIRVGHLDEAQVAEELQPPAIRVVHRR